MYILFQMVIGKRSVRKLGRVDLLHLGRGRVLPRGRDGQEGRLRCSRDVTQYLVRVKGKIILFPVTSSIKFGFHSLHSYIKKEEKNDEIFVM